MEAIAEMHQQQLQQQQPQPQQMSRVQGVQGGFPQMGITAM